VNFNLSKNPILSGSCPQLSVSTAVSRVVRCYEIKE
jgi:hypothetical protein